MKFIFQLKAALKLFRYSVAGQDKILGGDGVNREKSGHFFWGSPDREKLRENALKVTRN